MDRQTTHRRGFFGRLAAVLGGMATLSVLARPARADSHRRFVYGYGGGGFGGGSNRRFIYGGSRGRFVNPGGGFGGYPGGGYGGYPGGGYGGYPGGGYGGYPGGGVGGYGGYPGGGSNRRFIYGGSRGRFVNPGGGFGGAPGGFNIYMPRNDPVRPWAIDALSLLEA